VPIPLASAGLLAAGGIGVVGLVAVLKKGQDKAALTAQCEALRVHLETLAATGGDPHDIETTRVDLAACARNAAAAGVTIDVDTINLLPCRATAAYMRAQFDDYKRTSYTDPVARDNKRNAILSQGQALVACLRSALANASTPEAVRAVMADIDVARRDSSARALCLISGGPGCGRFAENETDGPVRARAELEAIAIPLGADWIDGYGTGGWGFERIDVDHWPAFPKFFRLASGAADYPGNYGSRMRGFPDGWTHGGLYADAEAKLATATRSPRLAAVATSPVIGADLARQFRVTF